MTDRYVAGALLTYLVTDQPVLRLFNTELFLDDGMQRKSEFCSAFLAYCLLTLVSQSCSKTDPAAAGKSLEVE